MKNQDTESNSSAEPYRVRLPGFVRDDVGLGTMVENVTSSLGIRPCDGCARRAAALDRWMVFSGARRPTHR
jgi:hypothetical protein